MQCIPRNMLCLDLCAAVQFASETHPFRNHSPSLKVKRNSVYLSVSMGLKKNLFFHSDTLLSLHGVLLYFLESTECSLHCF